MCTHVQSGSDRYVAVRVNSKEIAVAHGQERRRCRIPDAEVCVHDQHLVCSLVVEHDAAGRGAQTKPFVVRRGVAEGGGRSHGADLDDAGVRVDRDEGRSVIDVECVPGAVPDDVALDGSGDRNRGAGIHRQLETNTVGMGWHVQPSRNSHVSVLVDAKPRNTAQSYTEQNLIRIGCGGIDDQRTLRNARPLRIASQGQITVSVGNRNESRSTAGIACL